MKCGSDVRHHPSAVAERAARLPETTVGFVDETALVKTSVARKQADATSSPPGMLNLLLVGVLAYAQIKSKSRSVGSPFSVIPQTRASRLGGGSAGAATASADVVEVLSCQPIGRT